MSKLHNRGPLRRTDEIRPDPPQSFLPVPGNLPNWKALSGGPYPTATEISEFYKEWSEARADGALELKSELERLAADGFHHRDHHIRDSLARETNGDKGVQVLAGGTGIKGQPGHSMRTGDHDAPLQIKDAEKASSFISKSTVPRWKEERRGGGAASFVQVTPAGSGLGEPMEPIGAAPLLAETPRLLSSGAEEEEHELVLPTSFLGVGQWMWQRVTSFLGMISSKKGTKTSLAAVTDEQDEILNKERVLVTVAVGDVHMSLDSDEKTRAVLGHTDVNNHDNSAYKEVGTKSHRYTVKTDQKYQNWFWECSSVLVLFLLSQVYGGRSIVRSTYLLVRRQLVMVMDTRTMSTITMTSCRRTWSLSRMREQVKIVAEAVLVAHAPQVNDELSFVCGESGFQACFAQETHTTLPPQVNDELSFVCGESGFQACSSFAQENTFSCTRDIADSARIRTFIELNMELSGIFYRYFVAGTGAKKSTLSACCEGQHSQGAESVDFFAGVDLRGESGPLRGLFS